MAVKQISLLRGSEAEQARIMQMTMEEIDMLATLNHPHVIRFFGAVQVRVCREGAGSCGTDGYACLQEETHINVFVEWMSGGSVSFLLDRHGAFKELVILRYTCQLLLGLDYLHSQGILHRDLKGTDKEDGCRTLL